MSIFSQFPHEPPPLLRILEPICNIYYSINNGTSWILITTVTNNNLASQTYNWAVPNGVNTSQCLVKVEDYNYSTNFDVSNSTFTIFPNNDITVTSLSPQSPLGHQLMGLKVNDVAEINSMKYVIECIE